MIITYHKKQPMIASDAYVSSTAVIIGDVILGSGASVWFGTVIRGDKDQILIGEDSNIQDNCTLHTDPAHILCIGKRVSVGHQAILHGAFIDDEVLIGMGAIVLNGAHIGSHCIIGAGALIKENQTIPPGSLVVGSPGKVIKSTSPKQIQEIIDNASHYRALGQEYKTMEGL